MLMSQGARSAAVIGCPYLGASAASAALKTSASAAAKADSLSIDMAHLALGIDPPARDGVAVLHGEPGHIGRTPGWTALGNECLSCRLHVTGLVGRTALQDHRPAVQVHGTRKRVNALLSTGACSPAGAQLLPPSADTSTLLMRPFPENEMPEIS